MKSETPTTPERPPIDLKNHWLAAGLALAVPGLGHLYQGRHFKAAVYCVCILGLFFTGQALGEWKVVYLSDSNSAGRFAVGGKGMLLGRLLHSYGAQFPVGVAAWPALIQSRRYQSADNDGRVRLEEPLTAPISAELWIDSADFGPIPLTELEGTITLEPNGAVVVGTFEGTREDGTPTTVELRRVIELGPRVSAENFRLVSGSIDGLPEGVTIPQDVEIPANSTPYFKGWFDRPFLDRYQVPLGKDGEDALTARLGALAEIAWVFTWIAGLLNVLAIWDAFDGPAYGIGTEPELQRKKRRKKSDEDSKSDKEKEEARSTQAVASPTA